MSKDYYKILGIEKTADQGTIKKAFYKLAQQYHPDKPNGDEAKFKEINEAYQVLSNEQKRAQYDRFGSAGPNMGGFGGEQGFGGFDFSNMDFSGFRNQGGNMHFEFGDLGDIFSMFTGQGGGRRVRRGRDLSMELRITFKESIYGTTKDITVPGINGAEPRSTTINIPAGIEQGQRLRVRGYGEVVPEGQPGDLFLVILVEPHKIFRREGMHLVMPLQVKLTDAILGAKYPIKLLDNKEISVKIPKSMKSGQILRVRSQGVASRGDLLIQTNIIIPDKLSKKAKKAVETLQSEGW